MAIKSYLDYNGLRRVLTKLLPGHRKIWHGTQSEWDSLPAAEKAEYDQAEIEEPDYADDSTTNLVESGNNKSLTSHGFASFLKRMCSVVYTHEMILQTVEGWNYNLTCTIPNVPKGVYLLSITVRGESSGAANPAWFVGAECEGVTCVLSASSDIFETSACGNKVISIDSTQNVTLTYSFYKANASNKAGFRALLIRIR